MHCHPKSLILSESTVSESPRNCHSTNIISPGICPRSKLSAEMSKLEIPTLRKRASSEAVRESEESRKKVTEEKEMDMSDMIAEIKNIKEARGRTETNARENGKRVKKRPRMIRRVRCCACEKKAGVKYNGTCCSYCEHTRCPECMVQEPQDLV